MVVEKVVVRTKTTILAAEDVGSGRLLIDLGVEGCKASDKEKKN